MQKKGSEVTTDLHKSKLLLACVVVSGGALILLSVVRALLVGVLVGWMNQFPGVLWGKSVNLKDVTRQKKKKSTPTINQSGSNVLSIKAATSTILYII